ncbi:MAG: hypothetical protein JXX29_21370, partial [Deltaproteobacteria bacterium]|nr:hypothetical protein [Deltaproteobacteria bacterium]
MKQLKYLLGALAILSGFAGKPVISADSETQAQEAFVEGTKLYNQEKYEEAAAKFVEADRLYPNWKLQFNIGQSYAAARKYGLAVEAFEKYLALGGDEIPEERERVVIDEINNLHMKTGLLEVRGTDGTVLMIDGVRRGILPLPGKIRVSAGIIHQIAGVRDGVTIFEREIRLGVGEQAEIQIGNDAEDAPSQVAKPVIGSSEEPSSSANEDASNSPVLEKPSRTLKNAGIVSLAMGGAALVVGGITGGVAMKKNDELKSDCGD